MLIAERPSILTRTLRQGVGINREPTTRVISRKKGLTEI
jgi:hypothetical protein